MLGILNPPQASAFPTIPRESCTGVYGTPRRHEFPFSAFANIHVVVHDTRMTTIHQTQTHDSP